ncbi:MAG: glutathione S-transferase family protein [Hyphomonadaceae bacterium]
MLTLYHAPRSRSSRVIWLLEELGAPYEVRLTKIPRQDGSGGIDPDNPHPDRKVPALVDDGALITESIAIFLYLTDKFPEAKLAPRVGDPLRGPYLSWLAYYAGVIEPVLNVEFAGQSENPVFKRAWRGKEDIDARILGALKAHHFLLSLEFSAVDILIGSVGHWMRDALPSGKIVDEYLARVNARPALARAQAKDGEI